MKTLFLIIWLVGIIPSFMLAFFAFRVQNDDIEALKELALLYVALALIWPAVFAAVFTYSLVLNLSEKLVDISNKIYVKLRLFEERENPHDET